MLDYNPIINIISMFKLDMRYLQLFLIVFLSLIQICLSVDSGNFKTCSQSSFCKRNRNLPPDYTTYSLIHESVRSDADNGMISFHLKDATRDITLIGAIYTLKKGIVRFTLQEYDPPSTHPRFSPAEFTLVGEPPRRSYTMISDNSKYYTLSSGNIGVTIESNPFRVQVDKNGIPFSILNNRGLLNMEPYLHKENRNFTEPDAEGLWEETFKSHRDSKPHGPSSVGLDIRFIGAELVYGIPEHADSLPLKDTKSDGGDPYRLYNLDVFEYGINSRMALYGAVPLMYSIGVNGSTGLFWMNAAETWIDIEIKSGSGDSTLGSLFNSVFSSGSTPYVDTHWISESGMLDVFILPGPSPQAVSGQYAHLTGTTPIPPLWSLGYHQCRWNYKDQSDVAQVSEKLEENLIPYDAIWLDIEHTNGKKYFTWDSNKFPDSIAMLNEQEKRGHKMVVTIDPHIKRDNDYRLYKELTDGDMLVKSADGSSVYEGSCWPGGSVWPDFLNPKVRTYWAEQYLIENFAGSTGNLYPWNDMNEPSVFTGPETTMHKDAIHMDGWEHRDIHNLFAMLVTIGTYEGLLMRSNNNIRPFILTRGFFAGSQRNVAVWTGDNEASWEHLRAVFPMCLSVGLGGVPFVGSDVGGFFKHPTPELLVRWYQVGAYSPFFRSHAHIDTPRREPWLFGEEVLNLIRNAVQTRYQLLPYWYTLFHNHSITGSPVLRPIWYEFPNDKQTWSIAESAMLGPAIMISPVLEQGRASLEIYFPEEGCAWYDRDTFDRYPGGETRSVSTPIEKIPVFLRAGHVIPFKMRLRRSAISNLNDPYTLYVVLDRKFTASGQLYIDDASSFQYRQGEYRLLAVTYGKNILTIKTDGGHLKTNSWVERVLVIGLNAKPNKITREHKGSSEGQIYFTWTAASKILTIKKPIEDLNTTSKLQLYF